jgi:asparagine synthase (glutamine-hydrolysing)
MCGIAGALAFGAGQPGRTDEQLRCMAHRGPDADGVFERGPGWVGQTRLSIIDLARGDPPIANETRTIGVALNGEIYNYRELRAGLLERGHQLHTQGDAEVIAHLAEELGAEDVARALDGMFAYALWDAERQELTLARDRCGKKPLHYWHDGERLVFGSEIKTVLAHPAVPRRLDPAAIPAHLAFGYVPTPRTFFEGVLSVPPGSVLVYDGHAVDVRSFWEPPLVRPGEATRLDVSFDDATRLVRAELESAVTRRLVSDVPVGAFLSGGVDSSAVVALMARAMGGPQVKTFTVGFDDRHGFDEREPARRTAALLGTDHHEFVVEPDIATLAESLVWHHDQPFGDSSAVPVYLLSECTLEHVTVALTGDGGDEAFAGYERFSAAATVHLWHKVPRSIRDGVRSLVLTPRVTNAKHPLRKVQRFVSTANEDVFDAYTSWLLFADDETRRSLLGRVDTAAIDAHRAVWDASAGAAVPDRLLDLNLRTYLLDDLLPKADRMSMAHALEVRSPFLDHHLVSLALRLPPSARQRGMQRKRVLRAAVADVVPEHVLKGPKRGFAVPVDRWFREDLRAWATDLLGDGASVRAHLDGATIDRLLAEHLDGARLHGQLLWALLTLELFLRREGW